MQWAGVLTSLALAGERPAQEIVSAAVTDPDVQRDAARSSSRWTRAAAALMGQPQLPEIWPVIRATLATSGVLAALLEGLIAADPKGTWPPVAGQLPEAALADLYIMVT